MNIGSAWPVTPAINFSGNLPSESTGESGDIGKSSGFVQIVALSIPTTTASIVFDAPSVII
jgi:hypothetical protein